MPCRSVDVVVVGAGLAGLTVARQLAGQGFDVLLLDRKRSVGHAIHTTGIFTRQTLLDFAIPADLLGPPIRRVVLCSPSLRAIEFESGHDEFRIARMGELYLNWLAGCQTAGVQFLPSTTFLGVEGGLVRIRSRGKLISVRTRFVVGADGARSHVAPCLGLSRNQRFLVGVEEIVSSRGGSPRLECYVDPQLAPGYIGWIADDGEQSHIGVGGDPGRFDPARALHLFKQRAGLTAGEVLERRGGLIPIGGVLPEIANRFGALVGDAAGAVSPLTAGGFDPALRLSHRAAHLITGYLTHGDERGLRSYCGALLNPRRKVLLRQLFSMLRSRAILEAACFVLGFPPLDSMAREVFFGPGSFARIAACQPAIAGGTGGDSN